MIPPSLRLRRAITVPDAPLVLRLLNSHPSLLHNPDFSPSGLSNTNLHLAASLGHLEIVTLLLEKGHEKNGVSLNEDYQTPLMLASMGGWAETVHLVCTWDVSKEEDGLGGKERGSGAGEDEDEDGDGQESGAEKVVVQDSLGYGSSRAGGGVGRRDRWGRDAVMYASRGGWDTCLQILLTFAPQPLSMPAQQEDEEELTPAKILLQNADIDGNTALHFASSNGHLLALRTLLAAGADADRRNIWSWTAMSYSATVAAEVYFKGLVAEVERKKVVRRQVVGQGKGGGLRLVRSEGE